MLNLHISIYLSNFISFIEVIKLSKLDKKNYKFFTNDIIWKILGKRDHPLLNINSISDYRDKNLFYISSIDLYTSIENNNWAKKWYYGDFLTCKGEKDYLVKEFIKEIMKTMLQVEKFRRFYQLNQGGQPIDWKLSINRTIDNLLKISEDDKADMYLYIDRQLADSKKLLSINKHL